MIVCICHRVSDRDIRAAVAAGCRSFDELQDDLRVATACGACHDCALECFAAAASRSELQRAAGGVRSEPLQRRSAASAAATMLAESTSK